MPQHPPIKARFGKYRRNAESDDSGTPRSGVGKRMGDVGGMSAVDHEVTGAALGVDLGDRSCQRRAVRQSAVLFDGE